MLQGLADPRAAAVAAELAPYAWRDLTEAMLARRVIAAVDRHSVVRLVSSVPGAAVGVLDRLDPVGAADLRVDVLAAALRQRRWRGSTLGRLCVDLLATLDGWQAERDAGSPPGGYRTR